MLKPRNRLLDIGGQLTNKKLWPLLINYIRSVCLCVWDLTEHLKCAYHSLTTTINIFVEQVKFWPGSSEWIPIIKTTGEHKYLKSDFFVLYYPSVRIQNIDASSPLALNNTACTIVVTYVNGDPKSVEFRIANEEFFLLTCQWVYQNSESFSLTHCSEQTDYQVNLIVNGRKHPQNPSHEIWKCKPRKVLFCNQNSHEL